MEIGSIVCFCAVHSHGFKMLFSLSAVLRHTPCPPVGFTILKAGLNKSVLLSVYSSQNSRDGEDHRNLHGTTSLLLTFWIFFMNQCM
jgi:piezo-type mechanosensitive ion channel component 1/2